MAIWKRFSLALASLVLLATLVALGQVAPNITHERLVNSAKEPHNWLSYSGNYFSQRYSELTQITPANVGSLELKWMYQGATMGTWQATPLVADGIMYVSQRPNDVVALDAKTGRVFWIYQYNPAPDHQACCGANNRGLAIAGDTLFMATLDARLIAIDARTGRPLWNVQVDDHRQSYAMTNAPLVVKDKVITGVGGGDRGIRGSVVAYDIKTGKEVWRFYTIPGPGEKGHESWEKCPPTTSQDPTNPNYCDPEAWKHGGGAIWLTGSYDATANLTYWGVGNVWPDYNNKQRPGDNLFTESVVALDADTGKLRWHFQFTPNGSYDYDAVQIPVLADMSLLGAPTKAMLFANRNGFFYVLDRITGKFLQGRPFVQVNWASSLDETGRPNQTPQPLGKPTYPGIQGGTNWYSPSYSPRTGLFYVSAWENYATLYGIRAPVQYKSGGTPSGNANRQLAPVPGAPTTPAIRRGPINNWTDASGNGAILALDPNTGWAKWKYQTTDVADGGIMTTASNVLFTGSREGYFQALDAAAGTLLWKVNLGAQIINGPITYQVDGKQYVVTISGMSLVTFALRD